jgi:AraC-like DNA-binding protein
MQANAPIELSDQVQDSQYFSFHRDAPSAGNRLNLLFAGMEHCKPEYRFARQGFPVYILEVVLGGTGTLVLDGEEWKLAKDALYLYGPAIPCSIVNDPDAPLQKSFIAFSFPDGNLREVYPLQRLFICASDAFDQGRMLIRQFFEEAFHADPFSTRICANCLDTFLLNWVRFEAERKQVKRNSRQAFLRLKERIEDNFLEFDSMEAIGKAASLSPSYISRLFKQHYHMSPYHFLLKKKMEYAMDLLNNTRLSVGEVARECGFEDPFHFSRLFKSMMHKSPSCFKAER